MMRKRTLEYDDVMNKQREVIYDLRHTVLLSENPREQLYDIIMDVIHNQAEFVLEANTKNAKTPFIAWANEIFPIGMKEEQLPEGFDAEEWSDAVFARVKESYELKKSIARKPRSLRQTSNVKSSSDRLTNIGRSICAVWTDSAKESACEHTVSAIR